KPGPALLEQFPIRYTYHRYQPGLLRGLFLLQLALQVEHKIVQPSLALKSVPLQKPNSPSDMYSQIKLSACDFPNFLFWQCYLIIPQPRKSTQKTKNSTILSFLVSVPAVEYVFCLS